MPEYDDANWDPPAPVASVVLRNPETGAEIADVQMLIDTGADATLIPQDAVTRLGCRPTTMHTLSGFDGATGSYDEVIIEMLFLGKSFTGQFLTIDQPRGIIGRNILNYLVLTFDGPRLTWHETKRQ